MDQNTLDILQNMRTVSLDLETTGVKATDQVWSGGFYSVEKGAVFNEHQSFFDINTSENYKKMSRVSDIEEVLENAHSSSEFGARQAGKGLNADGKKTTNVLNDWAQAMLEHNVGTTDNFIERLSNTLDNGNKGSVLLLQNVNFEDRVLSQMYSKGSLPSFEKVIDRLGSPGLPASTNPSYGESFNKYLLPRDIYEQRLSQRDALKSVFNKYGQGENAVNELLNYRRSSFNIVNQYLRNVEEASKTGTTAVIDLMDFTRALYAHGANSGQVPTELLGFGAKVDTLSRALLGENEQHSALSDAKQQQQLFRRVIDELKVIQQKDVGYQSPMISSLVSQINKDKLFSTQLKERSVSVLREYLENSENITQQGAESVLFSRYYKGNMHLNNTTREDFNLSHYYKQFKERVGSHFDEEGFLKGTVANTLSDLETFNKNYKYSKIDSVTYLRASGKIGKVLGSTSFKVGAGIVGAGFVGSMMFGGNKEEQKKIEYNTYDEVYNNQYYGSAFADWQNRNNSHRMQ